MRGQEQAYRGALEAVDRVLNRGGDADDVLRAVVAVVHERAPHLRFVGIRFVETERLVLGPACGRPTGGEEALPISYQGARVAELVVEPDPGPLAAEDREFLERVALVVSPYCLVGWDTGGVAWSDVS